MIHELFGEINEIKVSSCHFDLVFYTIKKFSTTDEIKELICSVSRKIKPCFFMECISYVAYVLLSGQQITLMVIYMRLSLNNVLIFWKT